MPAFNRTVLTAMQDLPHQSREDQKSAGHLIMAACEMRAEPRWTTVPYDNGFRGEANREFTLHGSSAKVGNELSGEIQAR